LWWIDRIEIEMVQDVIGIGIVAEAGYPEGYWRGVKGARTVLSAGEYRVEVGDSKGVLVSETMDLAGVLRVIQRGRFGMDVEGMRRYKNVADAGRIAGSARPQIEQGSNKRPAATERSVPLKVQ
jgi:hypothetical protein